MNNLEDDGDVDVDIAGCDLYQNIEKKYENRTITRGPMVLLTLT